MIALLHVAPGSSLTLLNLSGNDATFTRALDANPGLHNIDLTQNAVGRDGARALNAAQRRNTLRLVESNDRRCFEVYWVGHRPARRPR